MIINCKHNKLNNKNAKITVTDYQEFKTYNQMVFPYTKLLTGKSTVTRPENLIKIINN